MSERIQGALSPTLRATPLPRCGRGAVGEGDRRMSEKASYFNEREHQICQVAPLTVHPFVLSLSKDRKHQLTLSPVEVSASIRQ